MNYNSAGTAAVILQKDIKSCFTILGHFGEHRWVFIIVCDHVLSTESYAK